MHLEKTKLCTILLVYRVLYLPIVKVLQRCKRYTWSVSWIGLLLIVKVILVVPLLLWILATWISLSATITTLCSRLLLRWRLWLWLLLLLLLLLLLWISCWILCLSRSWSSIRCDPSSWVTLALWSVTLLTSLAVGLLSLAHGICRRWAGHTRVVWLGLSGSGSIWLWRRLCSLGSLLRILGLLSIWRCWRCLVCQWWGRNVLLSWKLHLLWCRVRLLGIPLGTWLLVL